MNSYINPTVKIYYTLCDGTIKEGNSREVPENVFSVKIVMDLPYLKTNNMIGHKSFSNTIFNGNVIPVELYLDAFGKRVSYEQLESIKKQVSLGAKNIVFSVNDESVYGFPNDKDSIYANKEDFIKSLQSVEANFNTIVEMYMNKVNESEELVSKKSI